MPTVLYDNFYIANPYPIDGKFLKRTLQGYRPYQSVLEVNATIPYEHRSIGLTVLIFETELKEYWYKDDVEDANLVLKYYPSTSTGGTIFNESPDGIIDGVNTSFTTLQPYIASSTRLLLNGQRLKLGISYDYIEEGGNVITFNYPPEENDNLIIDYDY